MEQKEKSSTAPSASSIFRAAFERLSLRSKKKKEIKYDLVIEKKLTDHSKEADSDIFRNEEKLLLASFRFIYFLSNLTKSGIKKRYLTDKFRRINKTVTRFVITLEKSHHNLLQYLSECHNQGRCISWTARARRR